MIINQIGAKFEYEGTTYVIGAPIVGTPESEYEGLYGTITEIRDGEDKETENETPDLYCSFDVPALPYEVKRLEKVFSDLYSQPKTIDDIILDLVIMAPSMVEPLDDLKECRQHPKIYILLEDWAVDGELGNFSAVYTDFNDAKRILVQNLKEEQESGCIHELADNEKFKERSTDFLYECYIDDEYCENHYCIAIVSQQLCASNRFIREMGWIYKASCQLEDFASKVSDWEEPGNLTNEQYNRMVQDPHFPERLQSALEKNDSYWEAYWKTVSEVAHEFVNEYLQEAKENVHPDCYTPEQDNPRTLNTRISYLYRDADNYKMQNSCVVTGRITEAQIAEIMSCLDYGEYFIPRQVGLPEKRFDRLDEQVDHCWFELNADGFEVTENVSDIDMTVRQLLELFRRAKNNWHDDVPLGGAV